jgi:hypothetical protein
MNSRLWLTVGLVAALGAAWPIAPRGVAAASAEHGDGHAIRPAASAALQDGDGRRGESLLDLAAMVPGPDDLPDDGYGISGGQSWTLMAYATYLNALSDGHRARAVLADDLGEAGWHQGYGIVLSLPSEDDPDVVARYIVIALVEYADDDGAESGYRLLAGVNEERGFGEVDGDTFGDRSTLHRFAETTTDAVHVRYLDLDFQTGSIVAQVTIVDLTGHSPPTSEAEDIGADLEERIAAAVEDGAPGLGPTVLRIDADPLVVSWDYYRRLDGETRRDYNETTASFESADDFMARLDVVDYYSFSQNLPAVDEDKPPYRYVGELFQFEDEDAAAKYVDDRPSAFAESVQAGYTNVELAEDAEAFGDQSVLVSFDTVLNDDDEGSGFSYFVRTDDLVMVLEVSGVPDAPLAAVEVLVKAQLACLEAGACAWAPLPEEFSRPRSDEDAGDASADGEAVEVRLREVEDSGVRGTATLTSDRDETEAAVELRGSAEGMVVAVHEGTCDDLDPDPVGDAEEVDEDGAATLAIPVALEDLLDEEHAIAVYDDEDDLGDSPLACGEIEP